MSNFNFLILLGIIALTTPIAPTQAADINAGALVPAAGNDPKGMPWDSGCAGNVKINDDQTITIENFKILPSPWGQVIAFSNDPWNGSWPNKPDEGPMVDVRPLDAVFVADGIANDDPKCASLHDGEPNKFPKTMKVKADGKKITKDTKVIGIYCLLFNVLFCRVEVAGKLDALVTTDTAPQKKCSRLFTDCWYNGGDGNCKKPPPVKGGGFALPNSKWTPLLSVGLVAVMLAIPNFMK